MRRNREREVRNIADFLLLGRWAFHIDNLLSDAVARRYLK